MRARQAQVVAEHSFDDVRTIHGVTYDGRHLWFAHGDRGELKEVDPDSGAVVRTVVAPADAGTAFDGRYLWVAGGAKIRKIDPADGSVVGEVPGFDATPVSGLAWAAGALYAGLYRDKKILKLDPATGAVLKTLASDRMVTGITFTEGELWHGVARDEKIGPSELRRVDPATGEVMERLVMPKDAEVAGVEADERGRLWCGDTFTGKLRAVKKSA